jgi:hypothetical protein
LQVITRVFEIGVISSICIYVELKRFSVPSLNFFRDHFTAHETHIAPYLSSACLLKSEALKYSTEFLGCAQTSEATLRSRVPLIESKFPTAASQSGKKSVRR